MLVQVSSLRELHQQAQKYNTQLQEYNTKLQQDVALSDDKLQKLQVQAMCLLLAKDPVCMGPFPPSCLSTQVQPTPLPLLSCFSGTYALLMSKGCCTVVKD